MMLYVDNIMDGTQYKLEFNRKVTIILGDSGIGKTKVIELIKNSSRYSHIQLHSDLSSKVIALDFYSDWKILIEHAEKDTIFIADEDCTFVNERDFSRLVNDSECYFIFITREPKGSLGYSYKDIYTLRCSGKYHESVPVYIDNFDNLDSEVELVVVEDSKSGYEFYKYCLEYHNKDIKVISSEGKDKLIWCVINAITENNTVRSIGIIADGAAIGNQIDGIQQLKYKYPDIKFSIFMPECFEELLLNSNILNFKIPRELQSRRYINTFSSYEKYYGKLLTLLTQDTPASYTKKEINKCFLYNCCFQKISKCSLYKRENKVDTIVNIIYKDNGKNAGRRKDDKLLFQ